MSLANCHECGKIYVENNSGLCPACYQLEEQEEVKVVDFLRDRGKASIDEIHKATQVKEKTILRMMKRGRFRGVFEITRCCETCDTQISQGRLCDKCGNNLIEQVRQSQEKEQEASKDGMRVYTRDFLKK